LRLPNASGRRKALDTRTIRAIDVPPAQREEGYVRRKKTGQFKER
jgi:hypothetical protein